MNKNALFLCLIVFALSACKKNIYTFDQQKVEKLEVKEVDFEYMSAKIKINYEDGKNDFKTNSSLMIKKDSLIWFSIVKGPAEVSRGIFSKDSVVILDKLKKTYSIFSFKELSEKLDFEINFELIQAAILGNLIFPYDKD
ncbi:MAG: DUF4292 domain-containing protein, partial [Cyclobacteriaceae bacterium]